MERTPIPVRGVIKPLETNCDCWLHYIKKAGTAFKRLGRYGKWHKRELTHHAFEEALALCEAI